MSKSLVIVESPAKAKTLSRYLGKDYEVKASMGHVIDLPQKELGVDLQDNFKPKYEIIQGKKKVVNDLKRTARDTAEVYLAMDPDREGEAIAWHLARLLGKDDDQIHRVLFNEITKNAVLEATAHPEHLNRNLFEAQQARRILDRLVGYKISPLLWKVVRSGLSAGRVQSVAVRMVCERENEIRAYRKKEYWSIVTELLTPRSGKVSAKLWSVNGDRLVTRPDTEAKRKDRFWIKDEKTAEQIAAELRNVPQFVVAEVERKEKKRNPPPPFITSTMQREAAVRFGWSARKTMQVAQTLYEGVEIGAEGAEGLITYMRTDSTRLAETALNQVRKLISAEYGADYLPKSPNRFARAKGKVQDAHEAVRPTSAFRNPKQMAPFLNKDQANLYRLIWSRFVACQMTPAIYDQTTVDIQAGIRFVLRAIGSVMRFPGFTAVYIDHLEQNSIQGEASNGEDTLLPEMNTGELMNLEKVTPRQHFTQPPPRFTESSLIRELEANGIGRPSTYAAIMSTVLDKEYVERVKGVLKPTDLGFAVNGLLVERFPSILNVKFTAQMESMLDKVEEGHMDWLKVLKNFYGDFSQALEAAQSNSKKLVVKTDIDCDICGSKMVIRWSRHGAFLGCSNFPQCKNIKQFERDDGGNIRIVEERVSDVVCDKCGSQMVKKNGRYGPFLACSNYPRCSNIKPLSTGVHCPREGCHGELVKKKTRRGKVFYSCTNYPKCDFATWDRPLNISCPNCGTMPLYEKTYRNGRDKVKHCASCKMKFSDEDLMTASAADSSDDSS